MSTSPPPRQPTTPLTLEEIRQLPAVVDLVTASRALGIGRTRAYALARTRTFPVTVIEVGRGYRVSTAAILRLLDPTPLNS
ncbi:DNA-binding protein [Fodinicola feengrottensis]|uniref:Helix-turn-helix domain-containing protein n=1 Tax=Fodinicola feengrottensis TaxID=435914 RepID=A0ABN2FSH9_9ACTN|nr:DNA-binding protein [Fodinicola feengrottensis]